MHLFWEQQVGKMTFNVEKQLKCYHLPIIENAKFFSSYCKLTAMQYKYTSVTLKTSKMNVRRDLEVMWVV